MSWLDRLLGRPNAAVAPVAQEAAPRTQELPPEAFTAARGAGREVLGQVMAELKDSRGIHLESLFCAMGALAGRACQASVEPGAFEVVTTQDGRRFYFGDALNRPLAEDRVSIWSLVAGAAAHDGARQLPDLNEMFRHNAAVLGSEQFGLPRLPPEHPVHGRPLDYADRLWPRIRPLLSEAGESRLWPVALGLAIQELMAQTRGQVPPGIIARIVMESAIPVSKVPVPSSMASS